MLNPNPERIFQSEVAQNQLLMLRSATVTDKAHKHSAEQQRVCLVTNLFKSDALFLELNAIK